mgnify:CR=1 FL=1
MATATPVLWTYKKHDDGRADIKLRFTDENRSVYLSLGIAVRENQWNPRLQRVRKNHRDADEINANFDELVNESNDQDGRLDAVEAAPAVHTHLVRVLCFRRAATTGASTADRPSSTLGERME